MISIEEEAVLALHFNILELVFLLAKDQPSSQRDAEHPEQKTRNASEQSPVHVGASEALYIEVLDESEI